MAKSKEVIKKSIKWNFIFFSLVVLCTMTMGIMATGSLYGEIQDADKLVAEMYQKFFPLGGAFILLAVFATGMSTVDSILLTSSSILSRDIVSNFSPNFNSRKNEFSLARYSALAFLFISTLFALSPTGRGAMAPLVTLGASFATLFLWPLLGMFYFKRLGKNEIMTTMLIGLTTICLVEFSKINFFFGSGTLGFISALAVFVILLKRNVVLNPC